MSTSPIALDLSWSECTIDRHHGCQKFAGSLRVAAVVGE